MSMDACCLFAQQPVARFAVERVVAVAFQRSCRVAVYASSRGHATIVALAFVACLSVVLAARSMKTSLTS